MRKLPASFKICLVLSLISFLYPLSAPAQDENTSYLIVHVHTPEGIEIASIPEGIDKISVEYSQSVEIYDGDRFIGFGAYNADTHARPIEIPSGAHTIKVKFNGMTRDQDVALDSGETKIVIFTFERINYIDEIKNRLPMDFTDTVSGSATGQTVWKDTGLYSVGGYFEAQYCSAAISLTVQGIITPLGDSRFRMEQHLVGGTSSISDTLPPPGKTWAFWATGFSIINQLNYPLVLPSTCDRWFVQGLGVLCYPFGGLSIQDDQGAAQTISSFVSDVVVSHHYMFSVPPGTYHNRGGFTRPAGQYFGWGPQSGNPAEEHLVDGNVRDDVELARYVTNVPYDLAGTGVGNQLVVEGKTDKETYGLNDEVKISCVVKDSTTGEVISADTITAEVTEPDGSKEPILLSEGEPGNYEGTFNNTSSIGNYSVNIQATKKDYLDGKKKVDFPIDILEILNGRDFSAGTEVTSDTEKLATIVGVPVNGIVADGAARLLLRLSTGEGREVTFSIEGGTGDSRYDGILRSINGQEGRFITVNTISTSQGEKAFVIYQAPARFVRPGHAEDISFSERMIGFKITSAQSPVFEFTKGKMIIKPPVLLIHGIWAKGSDLTVLQNFLKKNYSPYIFILNYERTNDHHFADNVPRVGRRIREIRQYSYDNGIAMARIDVVGHSMGGLLARIWSNSGPGQYYTNTNFYQGDINRLITLDSPHYGSFFADLGLACYYNPHSGGIDWLIKAMKLFGHSITAGAVDDLRSTSQPIINMNKARLTVPIHAIAGSYDGITLNTSGDKTHFDGLPSTQYRIYDILLEAGYDASPYLLNGNSDVVVSMNSQRGAFGWATFGHEHMAAPKNQDAARYICDFLNSNEAI